MKIGDRFDSLDSAILAVREFEKKTNQLFVKSMNSPRMRKTNVQYAKFKYSTLILQCKHGGTYRSHRKGQEITSRGLTTTTKMDCPAQIVLRFLKEEEVLMADFVCDLKEHNHEISDKITSFYPENRRFVLTTSH